jgi:outer membrane protein assembly factor BamA
MTHNYIYKILSFAFAVVVLVGCSTTSKLEEGEVLYNGVKKIAVNPPAGQKVDDGVKSQILEAVNVKPNNSLYSPYLRTPLPIGLWVYNHMSDSAHGFKGWFYNKFMEEPVLISDVKPTMRVDMIRTLLDNNGYFGSDVSYQLLYSANKKKAKISYAVNLTDPRVFSAIHYPEGTRPVDHYIDSLARRSKYLQPGQRYCTDSLNSARIAIVNVMRNKGFFFFRPEYIQYLADSTLVPGKIDLGIVIDKTIPAASLVRYKEGNIVTTVYRNARGKGVPDSLMTARGLVVRMMPVKIRPSLIPSCLKFRTGRVFSVRDMDRTQLYLSRLGIFSGISINTTPMDSLNGSDKIDIDVQCTLDKPLEAKLELNAKSKSNSYLGPGFSASLTDKNLFGGAEQLTTEVTASYEWQTGAGRNHSSNYDSYEFGASSTLAFPRLLAPNFVDRTRRYLNWTKIALSGDFLNRPDFFKMAKFDLSFGWEWHANRYSFNQLIPFKLTYTKLITTTAKFDSAMVANPAVALSFRNQFIPQMSYTYTYDKALSRFNNITWTSTIMEAGNIFSGLWSLCGDHNNKKMFGTPFSQFVKVQSQVVFSHRIMDAQYLVSRLFVGAAHAYGNSSQVPYTEQFYIGGANSIRAFPVRSVGPGSYHPSSDDTNAYYDETGTFRLEANCEYRFPIFGYLHGAAFLDAGNIWLLKRDDSRPGGCITDGNFLKNIAIGTGVGLRFDMDMLVLRADLGIGIHAPYDTGKTGYFNMTSFKSSLAFHLAIGYPF